MNTGHKMASAVTLLTALRMFTNGELSLSEDKQLKICDFETFINSLENPSTYPLC